MVNIDRIRERADAKSGAHAPRIALGDYQFPLNPTNTIAQQDLMVAGKVLDFLQSCCPPETWEAVGETLCGLRVEAAAHLCAEILAEYGLDPKKPRRQ